MKGNTMDGWEDTGRGGLRRRTHADTSGSHTPKGTSEADIEAGYAWPKSGNVNDGGGSEGSPNTGKVGRFESPSAYLKRKGIIIKMREQLGLDSCPYLVRWRIETPKGSVRLHHWLGPDDDRAFHDHPWSFVTFVLKGGYTDKNLDGEQHLRAPAIQYRSATHQHTVYPDAGGAWTIIVTGPKVRNWGFWLDGKFRKANKWFLTFGHHPCD